MAAVERMNEAGTVRQIGPARGLHGAARFESHLVKGEFPLVVRSFARNHEAAQISVRRDAVESVVMNTQVGHVLGHVSHYELSGRIEQILLSRQLKTEQRLTVQKALGPI